LRKRPDATRQSDAAADFFRKLVKRHDLIGQSCLHYRSWHSPNYRARLILDDDLSTRAADFLAAAGPIAAHSCHYYRKRIAAEAIGDGAEENVRGRAARIFGRSFVGDELHKIRIALDQM
jgi:acetyl-CoA carboxylase beta subunit